MDEQLNTGVLLLIPYRAMEARVFDGLAAAGFHDITPAQARVFQRVAPTGSRLTDLAAQAGITIAPPGALQQVDRGTLGIRLCLGHPATDDLLENALLELRKILQSAEAISFV